jgi:Toprim-like/Protein of unknown function (DUF3991)
LPPSVTEVRARSVLRERFPRGANTQTMRNCDAELERFRNEVSCAALLEGFGASWRLDRKQSTRRALKYRRGEGEVLIINHEERGWWDPHSRARGDIFDLVQFLDPSLNFGQVRQVLRRFIGIAPRVPEARFTADEAQHALPVYVRWDKRPRLRPGSPAWTYLTVTRCPWIVAAAGAADIVREGSYGSAWFAHRDADGAVTHVEIRGPDYKGSLRGGTKTLFQLASTNPWHGRLVVTEAPIDALSVAAIERLSADTRYAATGGGMGPGTIAAIERLLAAMVLLPGAKLCSATDANRAGDRYAERHAALAVGAGVAFERMRPSEGSDWNDVVRAGREA